MQHIVIRESGHTNPEPFDLALAVRGGRRPLRVVMNRPVQLDRQPLRRTIEVYHVTAEAVLTPEFSSAKLTAFQNLPEGFLR